MTKALWLCVFVVGCGGARAPSADLAEVASGADAASGADMAFGLDAASGADLAFGPDAASGHDAAPGPDMASKTSLPASDEFVGASLDPAWLIFHPSVVTVVQSDGQLHLTPGPSALWYNQSQGAAVYKNVTGDFVMTSPVHAHRVGMASDVPPTSSVHLAGLMARSAAGEGQGAIENYVFIVVGFDVDDLSVETKTTTDGVSVYEGPTWAGGGEAELRICRRGATFRLYKRLLGASAWTLAKTYDRADLPSTLEAGVVAYTSSPTPDITGSFDRVTYAPAASDADCTAN